MRLLQLHLTALHLQEVLDRGLDIRLSAELEWIRADSAQLTLTTVGLSLVIGGVALLRLTRQK